MDTESRLDLLPGIWKGEVKKCFYSRYYFFQCLCVKLTLLSTCLSDIKSLDHDAKHYPVDELLSLMARDTHSPEVSKALPRLEMLKHTT